MTQRLEEIHDQMSKTESELRESHRKQVSHGMLMLDCMIDNHRCPGIFC